MALTRLQQHGARLMSTYPHLTKTEIARRLKCSRRAVVLWVGNPEFNQKVSELRKTIQPDPHSLVEAMTKSERAELLRKLRQEIGLYLPEIKKIERLTIDQTTGLPKDFNKTREVIARLNEFVKKDIEGISKEEWRLDVGRLESELDRNFPGWRDQKPETKVFPYAMNKDPTEDASDNLGDAELEDYLEDQRPDQWEKPDVEMEEEERG